MRVQWVSIGKIRPYERNPKIHTEEQIEILVRSIKEYGWTTPILVDADGVIVAGHGRYYAARKLGLEKVPVIYLRDLPPEKIQAYRIADNRLAEISQWDPSLLKQEMEMLKEIDSDLIDLTGFDSKKVFRELDRLIDIQARDLPFDGKEVEYYEEKELTIEIDEKKYQVQPGDLWQLRDHLLICGDMMQEETLQRLMGEERAQLVLLDPPWNIRGTNYFDRAYQYTDPKKSAILLLNTMRRVILPICKYQHIFRDLVFIGLEHRRYINRFAPVRTMIAMAIFWQGSNPFRNLHDRYSQVDVHVKVDGKEQIVPHQKNADFIRLLLAHYTAPGELVLDPFGGSGTTLIVGEHLGRRVRMVEIEPKYCHQIIARFIQEYGEEGIRLLDRQSDNK